MKKFLLTSLIIATAIFAIATADISLGNNTIEVFTQLNSGLYFMIGFFSVTMAMYIFYLIEEHSRKKNSLGAEKVRQQQEPK